MNCIYVKGISNSILTVGETSRLSILNLVGPAFNRAATKATLLSPKYLDHSEGNYKTANIITHTLYTQFKKKIQRFLFFHHVREFVQSSSVGRRFSAVVLLNFGVFGQEKSLAHLVPPSAPEEARVIFLVC